MTTLFDRLHIEILKFAKLFDGKFEEIKNRKDNILYLDEYYLKYSEYIENNKNQFCITLYRNANYTNTGTEILKFINGDYSNSMNNVIEPGKLLVLTNSNLCTELGYVTFSGSEREIMYDSSCSVQERYLSIDVCEEDEDMRKFMKMVVDFQGLQLKYINVIGYNYEKLVDLTNGDMYNSIIKRPFFNIGRN